MMLIWEKIFLLLLLSSVRGHWEMVVSEGESYMEDTL